MELRQRGQRASESSNEAGSNHSGNHSNARAMSATMSSSFYSASPYYHRSTSSDLSLPPPPPANMPAPSSTPRSPWSQPYSPTPTSHSPSAAHFYSPVSISQPNYGQTSDHGQTPTVRASYTAPVASVPAPQSYDRVISDSCVGGPSMERTFVAPATYSYSDGLSQHQHQHYHQHHLSNATESLYPSYATPTITNSPVAPRASNHTLPSTHSNPYQKKVAHKHSSLKTKILIVLLALATVALAAVALYLRHNLVTDRRELIEMQARLEARRMATGERDPHSRHHHRLDPGRSQQYQRRQQQQQQQQHHQHEKNTLERSNQQMQHTINALQSKYDSLFQKFEEHTNHLETLDATKQDLLKEIDLVTFSIEDVTADIETYTALLGSKEELDKAMVKREGALWRKIGKLQERIGWESRREAEEWFGSGPHKVEMELEYPQVTIEAEPSAWPRIRRWIVIELAPLDLMPHAINLFLQQVHHHLWNGISALSNVDQRVVFGPNNEEFKKRSLDTLSYQEYSERYPHLQWTIGFAGRPAGPNFYINKVDNSQLYGPGGQSQVVQADELHKEADPCFGKVVEGIDVLEEINKIPTREESEEEVPHREFYEVMIVQARVISDRIEHRPEEEVPLPDID